MGLHCAARGERRLGGKTVIKMGEDAKGRVMDTCIVLA